MHHVAQTLRRGLLALILLAGLQGCASFLPQATPPTVVESKAETPAARSVDRPPPANAHTVRHIRQVNKAISLPDATAYSRFIDEACGQFQLDRQLLVALITVESRFRIEAISDAGAKGLTQVMPQFHQDKIAQAKQRLNLYSIFEPRLNIYVGAWVLRDYLDRSKDILSALQRYNGSLGDAAQSYAHKVMAVYRSLKPASLAQNTPP